ncbi:MAG: hypothetical protein M3Q97_05140 [Bacteroidota bacterium]|nr:hypothetical protein [Bacteroidota bacterium]
MYFSRHKDWIKANYEEYVFIRIVFCVGLVLQLFTSLLSPGFWHHDEHFQLLEFAGLKAGLTTADDLPWEYYAQIRPAIQPYVALAMLKIFTFFGSDDTFQIATALRLLSGFLGWFSSFFLTMAIFPWLPSRLLKRILILLSVLTWFVLFTHARFSSESWSGSLFFIALGLLIFCIADDNRRKLSLNMLVVGVLLGLSFAFRYQNGLLLPGLFLWCLFIAKISIRPVAIMGFGVLAGIACGILADYFYYNEWTLAAYNYFVVNITENKAAEFGVSPWYFYLTEFLKWVGWPTGIFILFLLIVAWVRFPKNILVWTIVPFIVIHMLIGHKELRFLFPVIASFPIFIALSLHGAGPISRYSCIKRYQSAAITFCILAFVIYNTYMLFVYCFNPLQSFIRPLHFVHKEYSDDHLYLILTNESAFNLITELPMNFYVRENTRPLLLQTSEEILSYSQHSKKKVLLMLEFRGFELPEKYKLLKPYIKPVYQTIPKAVNINNWANRTTFWKVYEYSPSQKESLRR